MKKIIKKLLTLSGYKISKISPNESDYSDTTDAFKVQKNLIKDSHGELTIFDIGAYDGSVSLLYNELFPKSKIFCFEPFPDSFSKLEQNTSHFKNIIPVNKGLGEREGLSKFQMNSSAPTNSILKTHKSGEITWGKGKLETMHVIDIELTTLDSFVKKHAIEKIDILKMDVQGAEFMVLNGAKKTLEQGIVKLIYTEIITLPTYEGQKYFDETIKLIRSFGFELFNLYDYSLTDAGQLRQVDAIFVKSTTPN